MSGNAREWRDVQQFRRQVEQLRCESRMKRWPISEAAADMRKFVEQNQREDVLLTGFTNDKANPYRPKSSFQCTMI